MRNKNVNSDERTAKNTGTAAVITLALVWAALIIIGVYKTFKFGAESTTEEILLFLGSLLVFLIFKHRKDDVDLPESFFGKPLPTALHGEDKKARIRSYISDSLINGGILTVLNISLNRLNPNFSYTTIDFSDTVLTILINGALDLTVLRSVFMLINYIWGEHNIKKYNKLIEEDEKDE